ncbi:hypothetical protein [Paracraurococcus lichenis]|uniref:Uncharacterized protein n=1 Tax=Paracraurococcus lichenis TaxID=3064888 RepID=A0ABT9E717_9PROT|nr:hypothetical protein [Paracraurococcus sp. LOR1-02]MDO9711923.1 hypothetical protein [Paracraurococcus sp. LOR1-02]
MMRAAGLLAIAGRHGPLLLCAGVLLGLALPGLAMAARPLMDAAVFCFTLGAFLKVEPEAFRAEAGLRQGWRNLLILGWTSLGVPLAAWAGIWVTQPGPALAEGLLLCTLAPPVGSAAALAAMLGLSAPVALLASVAATAVAPLSMPLLANWLAGYALHIDAGAMGLRLLLLVGGGALASWGLRRAAPRLVAGNPLAMTGIAVVALVVFAIGAMRGMPAYFASEPTAVLLNLGIAFAVNAGFQLLGLLLFLPFGRRTALTVGLVSGNRNIGLAWAAVGTGMPAMVEVYFAMSVFPIYLLPVVMKRLLTPALPPAARPEEPRPSIAGLRRQAMAEAVAARRQVFQARAGLPASPARPHPAE